MTKVVQVVSRTTWKDGENGMVEGEAKIDDEGAGRIEIPGGLEIEV